ncbi:bifunctional lysylphosphatidylglycerol flippase/synthetase MprF [Curtobacterium sp. SP.BCo]|uniref:bifunctional lysylphosphatidylglycerol flippase/synthetase MprF n=1 Tax=Curtobacterium sp. SP.BCo TaxID=3435229 RepID=UPI003F73D3D2
MAPSALFGRLRRFPVSVVVTLTAVAFAVSARMAHAEPDFPHHPPVACLALVAVILTTVVAERSLGSLRTLVIGVGAPLLAVGATLLTVTIGSAFGEAHAEFAVGQPLFAPSTVAAALLGAASAAMPMQRRWRVRVALWVVVLTLVLFAGHGSDLARALATLLGTAAGAFVVRRASRPDPRSTRDTVSARTTVVSALIALGAGTLVTLVVPDPDGVLSIFAAAMSDRSVVVVGVLLLCAAWLVQRGSRIGIALATGVLVTLTVVLADVFVIEPMHDDSLQWQGLGLDALEWQVTLLGAWLVPAAVLLTVLALRGRLVRARFRAAGPHRDDLVGMLRDGDAGTLGHMGTWHGNATWTHPGGLGAVAYRVRGDVALTVSDPACAAADRADVVAAFTAFCERNGWVPAFTSVHEPVREILAAEGWTALPVGVESVLDVTTFDLRGKKRQDLRTASNRADREGTRDEWTTFCALDDGQRAEVEAICTHWAADRRLPEMGFTLGGFRELDDPDVRLMLAVAEDGHVTAVTSWLPVYEHGTLTGYTLDVMRRGEDGMPGVMEFLIARTALRAREAGLTTISLSGTPLAAHAGARTLVARGSLLIARVLEPVYGFRSLQRFKEKFGARHEPLWIVVPTPLHVPRVARALASAYVPGLRPKHLWALRQAHRGAAAARGVAASRS